MKKGHRRTHSQTITISRPLFQNIQKHHKQQQTKPISPYFQISSIKQNPLPYSTIQSLLQKSQTNIKQRILYIENLQQPNIISNNTEDFSFGKGINFKLNNFKLNMRQIPEVPKSNQSTSLQGQNKLEKLEKQHYFTHQIAENYQNRNFKNQKEISKYTLMNTKRNKTASTVQLKPAIKYQKPQKIQRNEYKNTAVLTNIKQNPLKRTKMQYQTHKKNVHSFGNSYGMSNNNRIYKQGVFDNLKDNNDPKKKKKNYVI